MDNKCQNWRKEAHLDGPFRPCKMTFRAMQSNPDFGIVD